MATLSKRRDENVAGNFYVDSTCIDCDTCRWMDPATFDRVEGMSAVVQQPATEDARFRAAQALVACPTASIGTTDKTPEVKEAATSFPHLLDGNVYHCGYHAESSFGGASWFIQRPEGNILVDSPRFAKPLVKQIEEMGGIDLMLLTHKDDIADHELYQKHFDCDRAAHELEGIRGVEQTVSGDDVEELLPGLVMIPTPGHTEGHVCYLYNDRFLFTGDHLAYSHRLEHLYAFKSYCWYDWEVQKESLKRLAEFDYEWVLPGHGRKFHAPLADMKKQMASCLEWIEE
jgi:glyoxylase-like metal-dependent hydrolase (beta-lactamase superfamily II)/ferredoxin